MAATSLAGGAIRRFFFTTVKNSAAKAADGGHEKSMKQWRYITLFGAIPSCILVTLNCYLKHEEEVQPEFIPYSYLYKRTKIADTIELLNLQGNQWKRAAVLPHVKIDSENQLNVEYKISLTQLQNYGLIQSGKGRETVENVALNILNKISSDATDGEIIEQPRMMTVNHDSHDKKQKDSVLLLFKVSTASFAEELINGISKEPNSFWLHSPLMKHIPREKVVIEFSSPNMAKPFHVGHLRSTIIGNCLANLHASLGHTVTRINYLGDWGVQFGLLKYGFDAENLQVKDLAADPLRKLYEVYVSANAQAESDPNIMEVARQIFTRMENGDPTQLATWQLFRDLTTTELVRVYARLNVHFDYYHGESMYRGAECGAVLEKMEKFGLLRKLEDGRTVLVPRSSSHSDPDALSINNKTKINNREDHFTTIMKSDGTTLYLTRDIAAALHRRELFPDFDRHYYVVDTGQHNHFRALFTALRGLECDWTESIRHVRFGRISGMSTRKGTAVLLQDLLDEARERIYSSQKEIKTTRENAITNDSVADRLAVACVIVADLQRRRHRDYKFVWEEAMNSRGDTGLRLQYAHCRLCSLEKNCGITLDNVVDLHLLFTDVTAVNLMKEMARFEEVLHFCLLELEPCHMVKYLFHLVFDINSALEALSVKSAVDSNVGRARLAMFVAARHVLAAGMRILGVDPLTEIVKWLTAHTDPLAGLYTFSTCVALADLQGDGEVKLIVADLGTGTMNMKLKVYKGTSLVSENTLIDLPTGVVTFHMDTTEPRVPAVAVASGSYIYIYKNMRPYFKFTLPTMEVNQAELDAWNQARDELLDVGMLYEILDSLRHEVGECCLTTRTQRFLMCSDYASQVQFLEQHKGFLLKRQTIVTCFSSLKKNHGEDDAISCLVLGTESANVFILDPEAFTILSSMTLSSVPVTMFVSGLYDVEYRIIVACRNGQIYTLKRSTKVGRPTVELTSQSVGLARREKNIIVATMDSEVHCYSNKGKRLWTLKLNSGIICLEVLDVRSLGLKLIALALVDHRILIYRDKHLVDSFEMEDRVSAMRFGRFGREENALILILKGGGLVVKLLKRMARFDFSDTETLAQAQAVKLNIPKKTKLFVDQTMRERENCVLMHRVFQHDLYRLRLSTARAYVHSLETSNNPVSLSNKEPLRLSAQVLGLGPTFKLRVELQNTSQGTPSLQLNVVFHCDDRVYAVHKSCIQVPILVPGVIHIVETLVTCVSDLGIADTVRVFVLKGKDIKPLLTAIINMPVAEMVVTA